jgi:hypothetical protein
MNGVAVFIRECVRVVREFSVMLYEVDEVQRSVAGAPIIFVDIPRDRS